MRTPATLLSIVFIFFSLASCTEKDATEKTHQDDTSDYSKLLKELDVKNLSISEEEYNLMTHDEQNNLRESLGLPTTKSDLNWKSGNELDSSIYDFYYSDSFLDDNYWNLYYRYTHLVPARGDEMNFYGTLRWSGFQYVLTGGIYPTSMYIRNLRVSSSIYDGASAPKTDIQGNVSADMIDFQMELYVYCLENGKITYDDKFTYYMYIDEPSAFPEQFYLYAE